MSQRSVSQFKALYGSTGTTFPDNTTQEISEADMRQFGEDIPDSYYNKTDDAHTLIPQFTASGTDTYTATPSPAISAYAAGQTFKILFTNANTGAATINLNGVGAAAITKDGTTALVADDIKAGSIKILSYDGTRFQIIGDGSGIQSIVAGTNVTVDNTDPLNPIVSASGETGKLDALATHRRLTGNHTLDSTDLASIAAGENLHIEMNVGSANTMTVPPNSSVAFEIGTTIPVINYGAGETTITPDSGVTFRNASGSLAVAQYGVAVLQKIDEDEWYVWNGGGNSTPGTDFSLQSASVNAGVMDLDFNDEQIRNFSNTTAISAATDITLSNTTNMVEGKVHILVTGTVALTMPTGSVMYASESYGGRWNSGTGVLTLTGSTNTPFTIMFEKIGSVFKVSATPDFV